MKIASKITMPYIGGILSVNRCCYGGGYGRKLRREVVAWMKELAEKAGWIPPAFRSLPVTVRLRGTFRNRRATPDLANLHKVIGDAIAAGLEMNDRDLNFVDGGYSLNKMAEPFLEIKIEMGES